MTTETSAPEARTLLGCFVASAGAAPGQCAVRHDGGAVGYAELAARANRFARHLIARGMRRGQLVGILLERSLALLVAVLGTAQAGGAYVALGVEHPPQRLAYMLQDAGASMLVSRARLAEGLQAQATLVDVAAGRGAIDALAADPPGVAVSPD